MNSCARFSHQILYVLSGLLLAASLWANEPEVVVKAKRIADNSGVKIGSEAPLFSASSPWFELLQVGLDASPSSGSLSSSDLSFRGFSSKQLSVSVDGILLSNPGTGLIDSYDLPIFASQSINFTSGAFPGALGGGLDLSLKLPSEPFARGKASFGSHRFGLADLVVGTGELGSFRSIAAFQVASSKGDFSFETSTGHELERKNNDQKRIIGLFKSTQGLSFGELGFFVFGRHHEGGLAGPATFPTPDLRLSKQKLIFASDLSIENSFAPLLLKWQTHFDKTKTQKGQDDPDSVSYLSNKLSLKGDKKFEFADTYSYLELVFVLDQLLDGSYDRFTHRTQLGFNTAPFDFWDLRFKRTISLDIHSDIGWYLGFATDINARPLEDLKLGFKFARTSRPPSLSEMFTPSGIILGNPDLEPEKVYDVALYANFAHKHLLRVDAEVFYAYLSKAIFYVNKNAFFIEPVNAEKVHRGGIGLSFSYSPTTFLEFFTKLDWLLSRISQTHSPVPGTSPFVAAISARAGEKKGVHGRINTVFNAGSTGNLFGTAKTPAYALVNADLILPVHEKINFIFSGTNLLNTKWAKSAYNYPLAGFELMLTLEIKA